MQAPFGGENGDGTDQPSSATVAAVPATMRSVVCRQYGDPSTLTFEEGPVPEPGPGQVRIGVAAAGVNFVDNLFVAGSYQIKIPPPFTPGNEVAGSVEAVGDGADPGLVGQRVAYGAGFGGWSTHVLADPKNLFAIPESMSDGQAATFIQSYATAWFSLRRRIEARPRQTMLVLGAGGGIGLGVLRRRLRARRRGHRRGIVRRQVASSRGGGRRAAHQLHLRGPQGARP